MSESITPREQEIRERYPVAANPYGRMAIRDLLRLLDAERAKVARVEASRGELASKVVDLWEEIGRLRARLEATWQRGDRQFLAALANQPTDPA